MRIFKSHPFFKSVRSYLKLLFVFSNYLYISLNWMFASPNNQKPHSLVSLPNKSSLPVKSYAGKLIIILFNNLFSYLPPLLIVFCYPFLLLFTRFFLSYIGISSLPLEYKVFIGFILLIITNLLISLFFFF